MSHHKWLGEKVITMTTWTTMMMHDDDDGGNDDDGDDGYDNVDGRL